MEDSTNSQAQSVERQTAKIASIKELLKGKYIKQEGWEPNYILTKKNEKISRTNIIGVVVTIPENTQSLFIDDGTGKIEIRSFQESNIFNNITIGDIVLIIGRPRAYNDEIYINAEIIKKISNKGWLEYRKKEISIKNLLYPDKENVENSIESDSVKEYQEVPADESENLDDDDIILMKIKELDDGSGCDIQELVELIPNSEEIVENLLKKGEIFEKSPGKYKVLE
ncbi:MAG: OB-fold nucleic acid binding domain-containing protein [Candidatus Woesearchaeota archaeon]